MDKLFAEVIIPLALPKPYTYRIPREWVELVVPGVRVIVQFGRSKLITGVVASVTEKAPTTYEAKYLETILDEEPVVTAMQMQFYDWLSSYYCSTIGDVYAAALPSAMKLASETKIILSEEIEETYTDLSPIEAQVADALHLRGTLMLREVVEVIDRKTVQPIIKSMLQKRAIEVVEEVNERYKPKMVDFIRLGKGYVEDSVLSELLNELMKAPKQLAVVMKYLQAANTEERWVWKKKLDIQKEADASAAQIKGLVEKGVLELKRFRVDRMEKTEKQSELRTLSDAQQEALDQIRELQKTKNTVLLHGVTSSGKTEVYAHLMQEALDKGRQVLFLLPEIALTAQLVKRLQAYFGEKVVVYHSRFNQQERAEVWQSMLKSNEGKVVIGARSAVFLPYNNLGLVIIDEEHETSFKQHDPAPRYNGRDAALTLAAFAKAKTILGSATPSMESYTLAKQEKYGYVQLFARHGQVKMPEILVADLKQEQRDRTLNGNLSSFLIKEMDEALNAGKKVILFQNRRGYSPRFECHTCGHVPECVNCDIGLTYHKHVHLLICHYCGHKQKPQPRCPACGGSDIREVGFGTEKIEEEIALQYPKANIARMDQDTTRGKNAFFNLVEDFSQGKIDILVGTQMIAKGLDFEEVALAAVLNADQMLYFPDFRANERAFQLMLQVAGRAGRKGMRGKVVIQTANPYHGVIRNVVENNQLEFYAQEAIERKRFNYPPFFRVIELTHKHKDKDKVMQCARTLAQKIRQRIGNEKLLGPEYPPIARIRGLFHAVSIIKFPRSWNEQKVKKSVIEAQDEILAERKFKDVRLVIDVDPN